MQIVILSYKVLFICTTVHRICCRKWSKNRHVLWNIFYAVNCWYIFLKNKFGIHLLNLLLIWPFKLLLLEWQMQATFYSPISFKCTCYLYDDRKHLFVTLTIGMCSTCFIWFTCYVIMYAFIAFYCISQTNDILGTGVFLVLLCKILFRTSEGNR